jgi:hypothetical protein
VWLLFTGSASALHAHNGPPFPLVTDRQIGSYVVSVWTDPDATDDGTAAGQFWVYLKTGTTAAIPSATRADITLTALDRAAPPRTMAAAPVKGDVTRQFAAVVLDHEGPFALRVSIAGPLGVADLDAMVDATYDLRPARVMLVVYLAPFLLVGFLWMKLLVRRRGAAAAHSRRPHTR